MSMYIRLKRKNQTVFLHVEPSSTFGQIKVRLGENFDMDHGTFVKYSASFLNGILPKTIS